MHDLVVKGGLVVDGAGAAPRTADVAISDGIVTEVGRVTDSARETIDADGLVVTPGFVDVHTHFDGQIQNLFSFPKSKTAFILTCLMQMK